MRITYKYKIKLAYSQDGARWILSASIPNSSFTSRAIVHPDSSSSIWWMRFNELIDGLQHKVRIAGEK